jgi:hypothetical protein
VRFGRQRERGRGHVDRDVRPGHGHEGALQLGAVVEQTPLPRVGDRQRLACVLALGELATARTGQRVCRAGRASLAVDATARTASRP